MSAVDPNGPVSLRWHQFSNNLGITSTMLRESNILTDITFVVEEKQVSAHRFILAASSSLFLSLFNPSLHPHPMVYLRGVSHRDLTSLLDFMYKGEVNVEQSCLESFLKTAEELKVKGLSESAILDSEGVDDTERREFEDKTDDMVTMGDNSDSNEGKLVSLGNNLPVESKGYIEDISEGSPLLSDLNQDSELEFDNIDPSRRISSRIMQTPAKKEPAESKSVRNNQGRCRSENSQTLAAKRSSIYGTKLTEEWKSGQKKKHQDKIKEPSSEKRKRKSGRGEATSSNRTKQDDRAGIDGDPHHRIPGVTDHQKLVSASLEAAINSTKEEIRKLEEKEVDLASSHNLDATDGTIAEVEKVLKLSQAVLGGFDIVDNSEEGVHSLDVIKEDVMNNDYQAAIMESDISLTRERDIATLPRRVRRP